MYSAVTISFQNKWLYLQRVIPDCSFCFDDLQHKVATELLPTLFGCEVSPEERIMISLPTRLGGLNILDCTQTGEVNYTLSKDSTAVLSQSLQKQIDFDFALHLSTLLTAQKNSIHAKV